MSRRRYLVSYDVADDRRRSRVFRVLEDHGDHLQFSVFLCELTERERVGLRQAVEEAIHHREDQVLVVDLGPADNDAGDRILSLGRTFEAPVRVLVV